MPRKPRYKSLPIWVARVTERVHHKGDVKLNVVTATGKPRTIHFKNGGVKW